EQVTGPAADYGLLNERAGLGGRAHRLTPVADHLDAVSEGAQPQPVIESAYLGTGALMHRGNAGRGGGRQRSGSGSGKLFGRQQVTGNGPDQVMSIADEWPLGGETGRRRQFGDQPTQPGRGQGGVDVDASQIGGPVTEHGVELAGAR